MLVVFPRPFGACSLQFSNDRFLNWGDHNLVARVRVALSTWTGNGDLWDSPFQLEFSLAERVSMSSRFRVFKMADKTPVKTLPGRERVMAYICGQK